MPPAHRRAEKLKFRQDWTKMNYSGPKVRLSRRLGIPLTRKAEKVMQKKPSPPGQHGGATQGRKMSIYKRQLLEKQLLRCFYNVQERQLRNYFRKAIRLSGNTADAMIAMLETRLDAVVARGGLARSIYAARQVVVHNHILVNGKRVNIPSYHVKETDAVSVKESSRGKKCFHDAVESAPSQPEYLELDKANMTVRLLRTPKRAEIPVIQNSDVSLVVEYYAR
jgi:small subunit ribosomal protein S4